MKWFILSSLLFIACGADPLPQPDDIPALLKSGQEVDPCSCNPRPYTNDGTLQDVTCQYGWKLIVSDCDGVCTNGSPQWRTLCGPLQ